MAVERLNRAKSSGAKDRVDDQAARHTTARGITPYPHRAAPGESGEEVRKREVRGQDGGLNEQILFTAEQAGEALAVPGSWLRDKAAIGEVPCRRLGKHLRFARADLEQIAASVARPARNAGSTTPGRQSSRTPLPRARDPRKRPSY